ncbi:hypothetical protein [Haloplasma contractile]|uniref:Uncharacterized protein n=1 Tax=Haloplasma contractile SSD-17B TaxID=1033810 RepID=U2FMA0_9MOLU|nr:hypothetical protein [Haloplasma contractile]ERJ12299.1 hypothetical protein HLPCO_001826 [Haloplasma contractile SSD-17B]
MLETDIKQYSTTFSDDFMRLLNSHRLYGYTSKREIVERALQHYKKNYKNNLNKQNLKNTLKNMLLVDLYEIDNQVLINAKNAYYMEYLFDKMFFKILLDGREKYDGDVTEIMIANAENFAENKIKQIIKEVVKTTETRE